MLRSVCSILAMLVAAASPAAADWAHCIATGTNANGAFAYYTTVADLGPMPPERVAALEQKLTAYVTKADAEAQGTKVLCYAFTDQLAAQAHYSRQLNATARRMGWEHLVVVPAEAWLTDRDIVNDPLRD